MSLKFDDRSLRRNLEKLGPETDGKIHAVVSYQATKAESHMRTTAPWTDRTGNARSGLTAIAEWNPGESHIIRLFHRVTYGIWLEVRWAGKYAVILPTVQRFGPDTMRMLQGLFSRLGGGGGL
jgi:hypothetical protein